MWRCKTMITLLEVASQPATLGGPSSWSRRNPFRDGLQGSGGWLFSMTKPNPFPSFFFCLQHSTGCLRSLHNANQSEFPFRDWLICIDGPSLSNSTKWKTTGEHLGRLDFSQLAQNKINTFLQEGVTVWKVQHESIKMFLSGETSSDTTAWGQISLPDHNSFQLWSDAYVFIGISLSKAIPLWNSLFNDHTEELCRRRGLEVDPLPVEIKYLVKFNETCN